MRFPILAAAILSVSASAAFLQTDETLRIDSPAPNETVSGMVEIRGTAAEPGMMRFRVEFGYDPDPTGTWFPIYEGTEPVRDGRLGVWDTASIREGNYALRLSAYFTDGSLRETFTRGLRVRREISPVATTVAEGITPVAADPGENARAAAAFPAPTAVFAAEPPGAGMAASGQAVPLITGAGLAVLGFGMYWIRSRWVWWSRRWFIRTVQKSRK